MNASTHSGTTIEPVYGPEHLAPGLEDRLGGPGEFPFTRGIHRTMYRSKPWTMRQYAGFGTARETNGRFRYLLEEGQTGLSVALDLPTQLGLDSDSPRALGEVGRVGVAVDSLADMEEIFAGIPLDRVSTSFTINATAPILLAMLQVVAEARGVARTALMGTVQNDILKEFGARGAWVFPIEPSMRLVVDVIEHCTRELPRFHPISIASHYRDAGATPAEEAAYTLSAGIAYVRACLERGLEVDSFGPRLSFFWYTYANFFEEIAKYRAVRRIWAHTMRDRFGATNPDSQRMRAACVCGGHSLSRAEPLNNIARTTIETMAAALGGLQSVFTAAHDEAFAIPTELAARTALRVQQVVAFETDVAATVDPLAGSWFVESLTDDLERAIRGIMDDIEARGGMVECLRRGAIQRRIADRAYEWQRKLESGEAVVVGQNRFGHGQEAVEVHRVSEEVERDQIERLRRVRQGRDPARVQRALASLASEAAGPHNLVEPILEAVRAYATVGEMTAALRSAFGSAADPGATWEHVE
ncbi:MAG: methylmalonyl-CoA mutase [Deltaproteobacteria bacterium]|nr:methylmalonyl-CoA mutase [Deltaproteobacteria bacterium]